MKTAAAVACLVSSNASTRQIGQSLQQRVLIIRDLQKKIIYFSDHELIEQYGTHNLLVLRVRSIQTGCHFT